MSAQTRIGFPVALFLYCSFLVGICVVPDASCQSLLLRDHLGGSWDAKDVDAYQNWAYYTAAHK